MATSGYWKVKQSCGILRECLSQIRIVLRVGPFVFGDFCGLFVSGIVATLFVPVES